MAADTGAPLKAPLRNVELKSRVRSLDAMREVAQQLATARLRPQRQVDTYFRCPRGRLKLRRVERQAAQLVWYDRPDQSGPKTSRYRLLTVADPDGLEAMLTASLGVDVVVDKRREIYLHHNVRIHLDDVAGLGTFLEFEAVLGPDMNEAQGRAQVDELSEKFGLAPDSLVRSSYADLLREA